jgi:tripartite-type tricarboxylate transporter receptor subunit TctC
LGQPIIIENIGGADGSVGVGRTARERPDGYTICLGIDGTFVLNAGFYSLPYDVLNDFVPISPLATGPTVLVGRKTMPAKDLSELIAWLKAHPNEASIGMNTLGFRLSALRFQKQTATQLNIIPYRAAGSVVGDLVAGQIDLAIGTLTTHLPLLRAGSENAYAVQAETRSALAPDIPTFIEMGWPALTYTIWYGLFAPRGTPRNIIGKLNAAAVEALGDPAVQSRLVELGYKAFPRDQQTPEALAALQRADPEKWWPLIKAFGIKAE